MKDKEIINKIVDVLDSLISELSAQMGAVHTSKLFAITTEIEQMVNEEAEEC